jgi:hypothetical protein
VPGPVIAMQKQAVLDDAMKHVKFIKF